MTLQVGSRLGPYEITAPLGAGGMGEVYRARDTRLGREVAIKVLPAAVASDPERRRRFESEARAVSALSHPGIVTLFEIESANTAASEAAVDFLVMELVPGEPLQRRIPAQGLPILEAVDLAQQAAEALAAAHAAGVVHRDLKPANLMVTPSGRLKILDFGLARLHPAAFSDPNALTVSDSLLTTAGSILGTMGYLAPEQAAGEPADRRSDLFSLGVVLYEMLTGVSPFARDSAARSLAAVLHEPPPPLDPRRVPAAVRRLVGRCLEKDPARRPESADEVAAALRAVRDELAPRAKRRGWAGAFGLGTAAAALALAAVAGLLWWRGGEERWLQRALPEIEQLAARDETFAAYVLALEAERRAPRDQRLAPLLEMFTFKAAVRSEPAGATVSVADYLQPSEWHALGTTPIPATRVPKSPQRFRLEKPGFVPIESAPLGVARDDGTFDYEFQLTPEGEAPSGMVRVGGGQAGETLGLPVALEPFWIDRLEVSNRDFQRFVDDGGYSRREFWRERFVDGDRELSWAEATARLRDATGRPGPATWELGRFPEGKGELPVGGVSWYEASAYAAWAGKELPTFHHWFLAASPDIFSEIIELSNFGGAGPRPVGSGLGLGPWGTLDMAGNLKEWTSTASEKTWRYQLGGSWSDPSYLYHEAERAAPMARTATFGFRCARYNRPPAVEIRGPLVREERDFARERPADDAVYAALTSAYAYDRTVPLAARAEPGGEETESWRLERVSIAAGLGDERLPLRLFLPKVGRPPYTAVVFFPDSSAEQKGISERFEYPMFDFLVRSGRAVVFPVFANTYERRESGWSGNHPVRRRDLVIAWSKELGRTLDYLQTRPDIDGQPVAYYGFSLGAIYLPIFTALDPRFVTGISVGGGFTNRRPLPEIDALNFASRVRIPVLMIAGRDDFVRPVETRQRPLFDRLGTPAENKRLAILEGGHAPARMNEIVREILDWLDRWLGTVSTP